MNDFLIFIAPFIIIVAAIACAFGQQVMMDLFQTKNKVTPNGR